MIDKLMTAMEYQLARKQMERADIVLNPAVISFDWLDFPHSKEMIVAGARRCGAISTRSTSVRDMLRYQNRLWPDSWTLSCTARTQSWQRHYSKTVRRLRLRTTILPETPGVYLMKDARGRLLYVGKAGSLKKRRVSSYFSRPHDARIEKTGQRDKEDRLYRDGYGAGGLDPRSFSDQEALATVQREGQGRQELPIYRDNQRRVPAGHAG